MPSPSIIPEDSNRDVYIVLEDFGHLGRAWRETDETQADRATLVRHLREGQYERPVRIVAFNMAQGWSRDVTDEIADEVVPYWRPPRLASITTPMACAVHC